MTQKTNKTVPESRDASIPAPEEITNPVNQDRRSILRKLALASAAMAGCSAMPDRWIPPLLKFSTLPAHAATSNTIEKIEREIKKIIDEQEQNNPPVDTSTESLPEEQRPAETPKLTPEAEPENDLRGYTTKLVMPYIGARMACDGVWQDKIVFPKLGPQYGKSMLLVWSDGNELTVPDSSHMIMKGGQNDYRKYQPGGSYSGNNPDIPTMEVYAKRGTHPSSVTLYYK